MEKLKLTPAQVIGELKELMIPGLSENLKGITGSVTFNSKYYGCLSCGIVFYPGAELHFENGVLKSIRNKDASGDVPPTEVNKDLLYWKNIPEIFFSYPGDPNSSVKIESPKMPEKIYVFDGESLSFYKDYKQGAKRVKSIVLEKDKSGKFLSPKRPIIHISNISQLPPNYTGEVLFPDGTVVIFSKGETTSENVNLKINKLFELLKTEKELLRFVKNFDISFSPYIKNGFYINDENLFYTENANIKNIWPIEAVKTFLRESFPVADKDLYEQLRVFKEKLLNPLILSPETNESFSKDYIWNFLNDSFLILRKKRLKGFFGENFTGTTKVTLPHNDTYVKLPSGIVLQKDSELQFQDGLLVRIFNKISYEAAKDPHLEYFMDAKYIEIDYTDDFSETITKKDRRFNWDSFYFNGRKLCFQTYHGTTTVTEMDEKGDFVEVIDHKKIDELIEIQKSNHINVWNYRQVPAYYTGIAHYPDGEEYWYLDGTIHRYDGPAITDEKSWYYVHGEYTDKEQFERNGNKFARIAPRPGIPTEYDKYSRNYSGLYKTDDNQEGYMVNAHPIRIGEQYVLGKHKITPKIDYLLQYFDIRFTIPKNKGFVYSENENTISFYSEGQLLKEYTSEETEEIAQAAYLLREKNIQEKELTSFIGSVQEAIDKWEERRYSTGKMNIKTEAKQAGKRVLAKKSVKVMKGALIAIMTKGMKTKAEKSKASQIIEKALSTKEGEALFQFLMGAALPHLAKIGSLSKFEEGFNSIGEELRIGSIADVGFILTDKVEELLPLAGDGILGLLDDVQKEFPTGVRVKTEKEKVLESGAAEEFVKNNIKEGIASK